MNRLPRNASAPADTRAGANDEGYEARCSVSERYPHAVTAATAGPCKHIAVYQRSDTGATVDIPLPVGAIARKQVTIGGVTFERIADFDVRDGETAEQAIARNLRENQREIDALIAEGLALTSRPRTGR